MERTNWKSATFSQRYYWYRLTYEDFESTQEEDQLKINKKLKSKKEKDEKKMMI